MYKLLRGGASRRSFELLLESGLFPYVVPSYDELFRERSEVGLVRAQRFPKATNDAPLAADYHPSRLFWELLDALDEYTIETGQEASNGVILAVLLAPIIDQEWISASRRDLDRTIDATMEALCAPMGVARRDRELARQILMAHRRMVGTAKRRRRRPSLVQRQYFHDALVFLGIAVQARGEDDSEFAHWQRLAATVAPMVASDDGPARGSKGGDDKRRRRRGGRSRRRGRSSGSGGRSSRASDRG
jgi:poly(A) polymerase